MKTNIKKKIKKKNFKLSQNQSTASQMRRGVIFSLLALEPLFKKILKQTVSLDRAK